MGQIQLLSLLPKLGYDFCDVHLQVISHGFCLIPVLISHVAPRALAGAAPNSEATLREILGMMSFDGENRAKPSRRSTLQRQPSMVPSL